MKRKIRSVVRLAALLLLLAGSVPAYAAEAVDTDRDCSAELSFCPGVPAGGVRFELYRIADMSVTSAPVKRAPYSEYAGLTSLLSSSDTDDYRFLCTGMTGFIASRGDALKPDCSVVTDSRGTAYAAGLGTGFYYVRGEAFTDGEKTFLPEPFVLQLPAREAGDVWNYAPRADVKWSGRSGLISIELVKSWSDSASRLHDGDSVTVLVYADSELFRTVTLSAANAWKTTLKNLDGTKTYSVAESPVPGGYTASVTRSGNRFIILNRTKDPEPPGPVPDTGQSWFMVILFGLLSLAMLVWAALSGEDAREQKLCFVCFLAFALFFAAGNVREQVIAEKASESILAEIRTVTEPPGQEETVPAAEAEEPVSGTPPVHEDAPQIEMPVQTVETERESVDILGVLEIPALGKRFPVASDWSYAKLKQCPCRYYGSVYQDNLVIAGHSYYTVFGPLLSLGLGSGCSFTDMDGTAFQYVLTAREKVEPGDTEKMISGDWDLTLFTCDRGGSRLPRVALRFQRVEETI